MRRKIAGLYLSSQDSGVLMLPSKPLCGCLFHHRSEIIELFSSKVSECQGLEQKAIVTLTQIVFVNYQTNKRDIQMLVILFLSSFFKNT